MAKESVLNPHVFQRKFRNFYATRIFRPLSLIILPYFEKRQLERARAEQESLYVDAVNPLITVTIATYNRAELLIERAVTSVLKQTYQNFEIVIVGDACTDDTAERVAAVDDKRIRFINRDRRGPYPQDRTLRWYVAGTYPINIALAEAKGLWIAHLDDDDIFEPDHLEHMLHFVNQHNLEMAWGKRNIEKSPGEWEITGDPDNIPHSSVFFRRYLRLFTFKPYAWRLRMPVDIHIWRRMEKTQVRMGFTDHLSFHAPLRPQTTQHHFRAEDSI